MHFEAVVAVVVTAANRENNHKQERKTGHEQVRRDGVMDAWYYTHISM
jgi:hypothetical protein